MKNYYMDEYKSQNFINFYMVKNGYIYVVYEGNRIKRIPYSTKIINNLDKRMRDQAENGKNYLESFKKINFKHIRAIIISGALTAMALSGVVFPYSSDILRISLGIVAGIGVISTATSIVLEKISSGIVEDIEKNSIFIDNEEELREVYHKSPEALSQNLGEVTKSEIMNGELNMHLNSLEGLTLYELKTMRANAIAYLEAQREEKSEKVLTLNNRK